MNKEFLHAITITAVVVVALVVGQMAGPGFIKFLCGVVGYFGILAVCWAWVGWNTSRKGA